MTPNNKSDSLQPPEGGGFSPTLLMKNPALKDGVSKQAGEKYGTKQSL